MPNGLSLWNAVEAVEHKYTKKIEGREFKGDTVNLTYTTRKLTEALGPAADRWGWEVVDEKVHEYGSHEDKTFIAIHAVRMRLWFLRDDGTTGHIEDYGTTRLAYYAGQGNNRYLKVDEEFAKKSCSDAKSKLFVALGGSAQVWLGEFDRTQHKNIGRERDQPHDPDTGEVVAAVAASPGPARPEAVAHARTDGRTHARTDVRTPAAAAARPAPRPSRDKCEWNVTLLNGRVVGPYDDPTDAARRVWMEMKGAPDREGLSAQEMVAMMDLNRPLLDAAPKDVRQAMVKLLGERSPKVA